MNYRGFRRIRSAAGFTLVEVLIAAVIGSMAVAAGFELFISQNKSHIIQAGISDMQQNGRAAVDELVSRIRLAGYRVPLGVPCLHGWNTNPDSIAITYLKEPLCTATVSDDMPQPSAELKFTGCDISCFEDNTWAYIYDPTTKTGEYFYITQVQVASAHIQHNLIPLSKRYPKGSKMFIMEYLKYYVDRSDTLHPRLMVQANGQPPEIYSDNIEDLQFKYITANNDVFDTVTVDRYVRDVAIDLVARTEKNDLFLNDYRRDTLSTRVMVRNLAL